MDDPSIYDRCTSAYVDQRTSPYRWGWRLPSRLQRLRACKAGADKDFDNGAIGGDLAIYEWHDAMSRVKN